MEHDEAGNKQHEMMMKERLATNMNDGWEAVSSRFFLLVPCVTVAVVNNVDLIAKSEHFGGKLRLRAVIIIFRASLVAD